MKAYAPRHFPPKAPLVIALHGCTQTADEYDHGTGWSSLADSLGFAVVYPQQQPANNPKNCFSWFVPGDIARGRGEALSIREMVDCPMGAPAMFYKHSRRCSRRRDILRGRLAIACGQHPDIAGHGRKSRYGMVAAIHS